MYGTISQLKNEVGIAQSDTTQDAYLTDLLTWISGWIDDYCKRTWTGVQTVTDEVHDLADDNKVWLNNTDITGITRVQLGQSSSGNLTTLDSTAYQWNKYGRLIIFEFPYSFPDWPRQVNSDFFKDYVHVDYTWGTSTVPAAIVGAAIEAAAKVYRNTNVDMENIGDYRIMYQRSPNGPADVFNDMGVLDAYRIRGV